MRYRIFPSIGIARLGGDPDFFLGPEVPTAGPGDLQVDGSVVATANFKDATKTKLRKQGARFHVFESLDGAAWQAADLPAGSTIGWTVELVNKKSAVNRPVRPPSNPTAIVVDAANQSMVIDGGTQRISTANQSSAPFVGIYRTSVPGGPDFQKQVNLGQLKTDVQGRLIVLGGNGVSEAPPGFPIGDSFYDNPKWHDDVADGPITAQIQIPGQPSVEAEGGAWVIVAPPDYAPSINGVVTLYDVIRQVGISSFGLPEIVTPSYDLHIEPIIRRVRHLRFVHADPLWSDSRLNSPKLRSTAVADRSFRAGVRTDIVNAVANRLGDFTYREFQSAILDQWVAGTFDATPAAPSSGVTSDGLTRAALEGGVGQGFFPGIEGGIIVTNPGIYLIPFDFRFDHTKVSAGDITALMAQPWQADFLKCSGGWWPTQRPDIAPQRDGSMANWQDGIVDHQDMVDKVQRMGVIAQTGPEAFFETGRADPHS